MYHEHFGLREAPFRITPQIEYFFAGAQRGDVLRALLFALGHDEGIIAVSGEVGVGKTMLCRMLIEQLPDDVLTIYIANPSLSPRELVEAVASELGIRPQRSGGQLRLIEQRLIELYGSGRRIVMVIDEAHGMPRKSLEQVRLFSNLETGTRKLLQIVLFGQPELQSVLSERDMRSLRERVTQHFMLAPLKRQEVADYLEFRLRAAGYKGPRLFGDRAAAMVARASHGLIRRVNILADKTLLAAFAANTHSVTTRHVNAAMRDANFPRTKPALYRRVPFLIAAGLLLLSIIVASLWMVAHSAPAPDRASDEHSAPDFPSLEQAQESMNRLPRWLQGYRPFLRQHQVLR